jgi:hypothetical protein
MADFFGAFVEQGRFGPSLFQSVFSSKSTEDTSPLRNLKTTRALTWLPFLLFPVLIVAQTPLVSTATNDPQILWEFDTGG